MEQSHGKRPIPLHFYHSQLFHSTILSQYRLPHFLRYLSVTWFTQSQHQRHTQRCPHQTTPQNDPLLRNWLDGQSLSLRWRRTQSAFSPVSSTTSGLRPRRAHQSGSSTTTPTQSTTTRSTSLTLCLASGTSKIVVRWRGTSSTTTTTPSSQAPTARTAQCAPFRYSLGGRHKSIPQ